MKWFKSDMCNKCIEMREWSRIYMSLGIFHENIKQGHQNESVKQNPYVTYTLKTDMNIINDTQPCDEKSKLQWNMYENEKQSAINEW